MARFNASFNDAKNFKATFGSVQKVSTSDYDDLYNKPQINGVTLQGNKNSAELKLQDQMETLSQTDIEKILYLG